MWYTIVSVYVPLSIDERRKHFMNPVFLKTRELAEAIMQSPEFLTMKECEEKAMHNEEAAAAMSEYIEKRQAIEQLLESGTPASDMLKTLSEELDLTQQKMQLIPDIIAMTQARNGFSELINQVNKVLRFIITGETGEAESEQGEGGCTGSCATCGGCNHLN